MKQIQGTTNNAWGSITAFSSFTFFGVANILNKYIFNSTFINAWHVIYWRGLTMFLFSLPLCFYTGTSLLDIKQEFGFYLFTRAFFGGLGLALNTFQFSLLSLTKAQAIYFTYPIWTAINGWILLKERLSKYDITAIASAFIGVMILIFAKPDSGKTQSESPYGVYVALIGPFFNSLGDLSSRKIGNNISCHVVPAYLGIALAIMSGFIINTITSSEAALHDYTLWNVSIILVMTIVSWLGFVLLTKAFQLDKAARVAIFVYIQIVYATLVDYLWFGNRLTVWEIVGCFLIVCGNFMVLFLKCVNIIE